MAGQSDLFSVSGKTAIVTGASRGLGRSAAEILMKNGVETALWSTSHIDERVLDGYRSCGYRFHDIGADVADNDARQAGFEKALALMGERVDILVNSAGIQRRHKSEVFPIKDFEDVLRVNLTAVFGMCQLAAQAMLDNGGGKIINFASMLSYFGGYTVPAYAASKGGVMQLTKALSNEWASRGINVNAIAPGYMDTQMNTALIQDEGRSREILARIPAHRWGNAGDIQGAVLFLASGASDYVHGAVLPVDGGYLGR